MDGCSEGRVMFNWTSVLKVLAFLACACGLGANIAVPMQSFLAGHTSVSMEQAKEAEDGTIVAPAFTICAHQGYMFYLVLSS